jgi:hypothetical protein
MSLFSQRMFKALPGCLVVLLMLVITLACFVMKVPGHNWGDDFALYINQSKHLLQGNVDSLVEKNTFSIEQSTLKHFSPTLAPWGYPLLIAPIIQVFGLDVEALKTMNIVLFILFLGCFYWLVKQSMPRAISILLFVCIATNYRLIDHTNVVGTEISFLLFSTGTLAAIHYYQLPSYRLWKGLLMGGMLYFSFMIRTEGLLLFAGFLVWQAGLLCNKEKSTGCSIERKITWLLLPYLTSFCLYIVVSKILPNGFVSHFNNSSLVSVEKMVNSMMYYKGKVSNMIYHRLGMIPFFMLIVLLFVGIGGRLKKDPHVVTYFLLLIGTLIVWPFNEYRYIFASFPFLVYFIGHGILYLESKLYKKEYHVSILMLGLLICLNISVLIPKLVLRSQNKNVVSGPTSPASKEMFNFINERTNIDDTIIFFRPRAMTLYTDRKSAMIFDSYYNLISIGSYYVHNKDPYTICQFRQIDPLFNDRTLKRHFTMVFENLGYMIFKIN